MKNRTKLYRFLHFVVRHTFRFAYRRFECVGMDKIPTDGAVIFAPNHTNGLMDALALVWLSQKYKAILFVARADIFRNKKIARLLRSFYMLPIMRIRDGYANLSKNDKIMNLCVEALQNNIPFCIMPEGTHRAMRSQLPLVKGIFRIALLSNERLSGTKIYIVPVGINLGSFFRYHSSMLLQIGEPIDVTDYVQTHPELSATEQITILRTNLTKKLAELHLTIPSDKDFEAIEECCFLSSQLTDTLFERLKQSQLVVQKILLFREEKTEEANKFLLNLAEFAVLRKKWMVYADVFSKIMSPIKSFLVIILLLFEFPYFLISTIFILPYLVISEILVRTQSDKAMNNSIRYASSLILYPLSLLIAGVIFFTNFDWWLALVLLLILIPSYLFFFDYLRLVRLCYSSLVLNFNTKLRVARHYLIREMKDKIC